jgi:pyrimidine-nucleoside phosphorylase/thymidine phosphorylase
MRAVDIIRKKRDGEALTPGEIAMMVSGSATGEVADYQWAALLMAIFWRGMSDAETAALTDAMIRSGRVIDLSHIPGRKIDKHSTGGVGDKTSLIVAPVAAAAGVPVPMVSGRGLGHTGGTLDKLESIPGFRVDLDLERYKEVLERCRLVMIGQTAEIAPADKFLYALRDATGTVESIPLIAASIMSKKLAEGIDGLVLDVKTGSGAFMERLEDSRALAQAMCAIGAGLGKQMVALVTRMDQPLGCAVGNAVEVAECVECLRGGGPPDLVGLSLELGAEMLCLAGRCDSLPNGRSLCEKTIASGTALDKFRKLVEAQGGDPRAVDNPARLPSPRRKIELKSTKSGFVQSLAARPIGHATMLLGAGRARMDSRIDPAVGVILHKKAGSEVRAGDPLCTVLVNEETRLDEALDLIDGAFRISAEPVAVPALVVERVYSSPQGLRPGAVTGGTVIDRPEKG